MRKLHPLDREFEGRANSGGLLGLRGRIALQHGCLLFPVVEGLARHWQRRAMVESVL
jgi:hypothetical protein